MTPQDLATGTYLDAVMLAPLGFLMLMALPVPVGMFCFAITLWRRSREGRRR